jgi:DNA-binding XRE family transcriptional regulator
MVEVRMSDIGTRIAMERQLWGMTQDELAAAVDLTRDKIGKIETGERQVSVPEMLEFARVFEVTVEELAAPQAQVRHRVNRDRAETREAIAWFERCVENSLFISRLPALYDQG